MADYKSIIKDLKAKNYKPIYLLMGEEPFYIDKITDYIVDNVLSEDEKIFNQSIMYGKDITVNDIVNTALRYPMGAEYQVVVIKEAQQIHATQFEKLTKYAESPNPSTILVLNLKGKSMDKRKKLTKLIDKNGVLFESSKIRDYEVSKWIEAYVKGQGYTLSTQTSMLLGEYLGTDLKKITNELSKLYINIDKGAAITPELIQEYIGISKDYNVFELQDALSAKDVLKANRIVRYFADNQSSNPITVTISTLFGYYKKLLQINLMQDKSIINVRKEIGIGNDFICRKYIETARKHHPTKLVNIISLLREYDMKSKGVDNVSTDAGELQKELIYKILH
ncbi:MAG: DNA polymerase III subunit delta [Bacteroidales bacterium]